MIKITPHETHANYIYYEKNLNKYVEVKYSTTYLVFYIWIKVKLTNLSTQWFSSQKTWETLKWTCLQKYKHRHYLPQIL